jgi:hypothetical protein
MKRISLLQKVVASCMSVLLLASCSTTEKMLIHATPGTKIYAPNGSTTPVVTVPNSGVVKYTVPSDAYYGYLMAQYPGQDVAIPFGLDTKYKSTKGAQAVECLAYGLAIVGVVSMTAGVVIAATNSDDPMGGPMLGGGGGAALLGAGFGMSSSSRLGQLNYKYHYTYQKNQNALEMGTEPLLTRDPKKGETVATTAQQGSQRKKATSSKLQDENKSSSTQGSAAKTRSDYAKNIQGTYVGTGSLQKLSTVEESYSNVKIVLERIDKSHVKVFYYESGEEYFESPDTYEISHNSDGSYSLFIPSIPSATIKIDKKGNLTYLHKMVIIDGDTYTLKASTERQER